MKGRPRKVLFFGLHFLPLLVLLLCLYPWIVEPYKRVVVGVANPVLTSLEPPMHIRVNPEGGWDFYLDRPEGKDFDAGVGDLTLAFLNIALLPALLLATPRSVRERLRILVLGVVLLFGLHVVLAIAIVRITLCLHYDRGSMLCNWLLILFATGGQVFGVVLWALLTWRYWLPGQELLAAEGDEGTAARNVRCSCGSGLRYKHCCGKAP